MARENTAKVIKTVKADIACIVEAESRPVLKAFNSQMLDSRKFDYAMLIDGNDERGIDIGLLSNFSIANIRSHIYDGPANGRIFSRDCLEVELALSSQRSIHVLCNHFKSKGYGEQQANDAKRKKQATQVAKILEEYNLKTDLVIVAGDLNDEPDRAPLRPLLDVPDLYDVLKLQFPDDPDARWTYYYNGRQQLDYVLVSRPLRDALSSAGVERRGIHKLQQHSGGAEQPFDTVTRASNAASDHGAVWAEFNL